MPQSFRVQKVAALIRKEMSELLMRGIQDQRVNETLITITEVEVSGDLQHCKIFLSIFGDHNHKENVLKVLESAKGFLKGELGRRLQMRRTPEILFKLDKGMEKGTSVLNLLDKLQEERKAKSTHNNSME
tara:strand:- start:261 stop:650 length:390 start_codon:yes stop_codon:yes gene_type:complete